MCVWCMCVFVSVYMCVSAYVPWYVCGSQKIALWSQFFPPTLTWVLETEFMLSGLYSNESSCRPRK